MPFTDVTPPTIRGEFPRLRLSSKVSPNVNAQFFDDDRTLSNGTYTASVILVDGANALNAKVTFDDGTTRTVTYDAPPVVTITSPRDWETFGPAASINGAPVSGNASNLTGLVDRPITITGTLSKAVTSVSINQQAATLAPDGRSFTFNNFFLREGTSLLSVNATDSSGRIGSANVTVFVDQTAPLLSIENPVNNAVTSSMRIDVRGIANDAVEGGLGAAEPVVTITNTANQQSITAVVSDRYYFATDIPLEVGANDLSVTATDQRGNARTKAVRVVRVAVGSKRITLLGGNRQSAPVKSELPQALQISAIDAQGNPLANLPVRFDIVRGNGSISLQPGAPTKPNGVNPARNLVVDTDNSGVAKLWLALGSESSPGGNSVRAWSPEIAEDTIFTATGTRGAPYWVVIDGNASAQFVQTGTAPVDALQSAVYDQNYNRMVATLVRYRILSGEALFTANSAQNGTVSADGQTITVLTDKDGRASVRPIAGRTPGIVKIISEAVLPNNAVAGQALFQLSVLERKSGPTKFRGVVMNHTGKPLAGVRFSIARTNLSATSDSNGKFEFADQVPPGKIDLFVDGRTVTPAPNIEYPALHFETAIIPGQDNQLPHAIYLPPVNLSASQIVGGNQDVTLTIPGYEGFELIVKANSVTFPDGSHTGPLVVSPVHNDRLPMVPPGGAATFGTLGWTIQPTGTRFDPPAQVKIPNPGKMTAGQTAQIVQWDHDLATFVPMGRGTVNEDASQIITDFGSGITKAGWGGCAGPGCAPDPGFPQCVIPSLLCNLNACMKYVPGSPGTCGSCEQRTPAEVLSSLIIKTPNGNEIIQHAEISDASAEILDVDIHSTEAARLFIDAEFFVESERTFAGKKCLSYTESIIYTPSRNLLFGDINLDGPSANHLLLTNDSADIHVTACGYALEVDKVAKFEVKTENAQLLELRPLLRHCLWEQDCQQFQARVQLLEI